MFEERYLSKPLMKWKIRYPLKQIKHVKNFQNSDENIIVGLNCKNSTHMFRYTEDFRSKDIFNTFQLPVFFSERYPCKMNKKHEHSQYDYITNFDIIKPNKYQRKSKNVK
eukprot:UN02613